MAHYTIKQMTYDDEASCIIREQFSNEFRKDYVLVGEEKTCLPEEYLKCAQSLKRFEVRDSDVVVVSYPKSGTTWTQEMVWLIANDMNLKGAEEKLEIRFPFLEFSMMSNWEKMDATLNMQIPEYIKNSFKFIEQQKSPRFIKTHLPFYLLPEEIHNGSKSPKIIYVTRSPKDTCVSFYHHSKLFHKFGKGFEEFVKVFLADKALYGSFWKHVFGYWKQRDSPNVLIIRYEDMKNDLRSIIKQVCHFLNKSLTEPQVQALTEHLSFESMKNNKSVNFEPILQMRRMHNLSSPEGNFIRSGTVGKNRNEMTEEIKKTFDKWIQNNIEGTDLEQEYFDKN